MSGDNFTDGIPKVRPVLGDVTNRPVKRGFDSKRETASQFAKQARVGAENLIKEKSENLQFEPNPKPIPTCSGDIDTSKEDLVSVNDKFGESKQGFELSDSEDTLGEGVAEAGHKLNENGRNEGQDLGVGRLASSKGGCIEWSRLPKPFSQSSMPFELERCVGLKNDGCTNSDGDGMLKACSCSFCLKAAYIWSDLHYQDLKGRIAVSKKSQKEARILVQESSKGNQADISNQGNTYKSSKLEFDLTSQWRSLFLKMEDIFVNEGNQLQTSYTALKDLRENCKIDLERITGMPLEK
ncbi:hypothetical protein like AT5G65120 [Hibiscus trionum]|uniref:Uncharacterized protein n=1 Tax=Hibiscus trionum TaxID=183268 RepID=A0A9W7H3C8_HIBTR|nr:hypothetical protein like AT5G65120 [Hibiscus trionum]